MRIVIALLAGMGIACGGRAPAGFGSTKSAMTRSATYDGNVGAEEEKYFTSSSVVTSNGLSVTTLGAADSLSSPDLKPADAYVLNFAQGTLRQVMATACQNNLIIAWRPVVCLSINATDYCATVDPSDASGCARVAWTSLSSASQGEPSLVVVTDADSPTVASGNNYTLQVEVTAGPATADNADDVAADESDTSGT